MDHALGRYSGHGASPSGGLVSDQGRREIDARGLAQAKHFDSTVALDRIEAIYFRLSSQKALFVQNTLSH
ncbi:MAG: hypothetical protein EOP12_03875 [Pseudomonas sp.]|nr:MAG: hypothetical protein EOP12_03875 [Pseudomonas sp.]